MCRMIPFDIWFGQRWSMLCCGGMTIPSGGGSGGSTHRRRTPGRIRQGRKQDHRHSLFRRRRMEPTRHDRRCRRGTVVIVVTSYHPTGFIMPRRIRRFDGTSFRRFDTCIGGGGGGGTCRRMDLHGTDDRRIIWMYYRQSRTCTIIMSRWR